MAKVNVSIPQGTRDFGPNTVRKRNYIFNTIRAVFEVYGFQPLETPAMENLDTLMGKYGEEGDRLIFKILNNGLDNQEKQNQVKEDFEKVLQGKNVKGITERALRYDLTIPFARYVAMNHGQLTFPFKRYQVQPVWRADRPQKGRYREFYQCDADVVGSNALLNEVELLSIYATVFARLKIPVEIRMNSRKVLTGIAEVIDEPGRIVDITVAVDKVDKIGVDGVKKELREKGIAEEKIEMLSDLIFFKAEKIGTQKGNINADKLDFIKNSSFYNKSAILQEGISDIEYIVSQCELSGIDNISIDLTIARGLNYYTGCIFEVNAKDVKMGSIGGGGRYDDLTGLFGVPNIPGVGISFGVDRIYDVMEELKLFPDEVHTGTQVLFFNLGENESKAAFTLMQQLRSGNTRCELYHETVKFDKQFKYAEKKNIPYTVIIGSKEIEEKTCIVKDIRNGHQQTVPVNKLTEFPFI
jgi:histidyl-tRNA synthetase